MMRFVLMCLLISLLAACDSAATSNPAPANPTSPPQRTNPTITPSPLPFDEAQPTDTPAADMTPVAGLMFRVAVQQDDGDTEQYTIRLPEVPGWTISGNAPANASVYLTPNAVTVAENDVLRYLQTQYSIAATDIQTQVEDGRPIYIINHAQSGYRIATSLTAADGSALLLIMHALPFDAGVDVRLWQDDYMTLLTDSSVTDSPIP